ncbi:MAG: hypothetical protein HY801_08320 [Candidatus Lindowbacteria bacterium]|nr:hypothetical protein [Candidatus Lindowbacteria bacterium]
MPVQHKEYCVRLEFEKYASPNLPPDSCHVDLLVDPDEEIHTGDLCYAPNMNRVVRLKGRLRTPVHKVVSVNCPPELALNRFPDALFTVPSQS